MSPRRGLSFSRGPRPGSSRLLGPSPPRFYPGAKVEDFNVARISTGSDFESTSIPRTLSSWSRFDAFATSGAASRGVACWDLKHKQSPSAHKALLCPSFVVGSSATMMTATRLTFSVGLRILMVSSMLSLLAPLGMCRAVVLQTSALMMMTLREICRMVSY